MNSELKISEKSHDYHGHPNYLMVYISLLLLLGVSLVLGYILNPFWAILLIFIIATTKVILVMNNFMHLKFEPKLLLAFLGLVVFVLMALYFIVLPDINYNIIREIAK